MESETVSYWSNWLAVGANTQREKLLWKESKCSWATNAVTDALLHKLGLLFPLSVLQLQ